MHEHHDGSQIAIGLTAVIVAVTREAPRILIVRRREHGGEVEQSLASEGQIDALPFGPLDPSSDRTLELTLRGWVQEQTGIELGYAEQLYTFGDRNRDPRERMGGPRVISIGYLTLGREMSLADGAAAQWRPWYDFLPWEDWREGRPQILDRGLEPLLRQWASEGEPAVQRRRRERLDIAFGFGGAPWDGERVLDRYELLYEAGLVREAWRDGRREVRPEAETLGLGRAMGFDHRRIVATALSRLRGKIKYRPVVFELLPESFTLLQLQRVVEALAGHRLHKQNFRRLVDRGGLVEGTGQLAAGTSGRPAELFRFRRDVLRERPTPGVGLPTLPTR